MHTNNTTSALSNTTVANANFGSDTVTNFGSATVSTFDSVTATNLGSATGPVPIRMNNDYLFRALLQRSNNALKGLICSLLHMSPDEVRSVNITNPIVLGASIDSKTFFLDVNTLLNNDRIINLELQVINEHNWQERSLVYLCRSFDSLNRGDNYLQVKPAAQISLLDFTLFREYPEFYATYQFMNTKNHYLYSDKLLLSVVDLTRIDLATAEDKLYHIDCWASLFKASTWEEIKMLAQKDEYIQEASETIYQLSQEEMIRLQCEAREDYYRRQRDVEYQMQTLLDSNKELLASIAALQAENERLKKLVSQQE